MDTAIVRQDAYLSPAATVHDALGRYQAMKDFVSGVLKSKVDYGVIPGTSDKPTLLKPGAEKLAAFFGLTPTFPVVERINDWTGQDHGGEPFFLRDYKCQLYRGGELAGEGCGSCNSWESKYRYRNANRVCPQCGAEAIIKGKAEYGGGFICFAKKGGCGAKFADNDPAITDQQVGKTRNPDIFDQVNTIDKMAQKRALIAAVLIATNASDYFTQDIEDFIDADFFDAPVVEKVKEAVPAKKQPQKMTVEMAGEVHSNSKNKPYKELTDEELNSTKIGLLKIRKDTPKAWTDEHQMKLDAAITLIESRGIAA